MKIDMRKPVENGVHDAPPPKVKPEREEGTMSPLLILLQQQLNLLFPPRRDERGLSQSTENAILLAGAVAIALLVVSVIRKFVEANLPQ